MNTDSQILKEKIRMISDHRSLYRFVNDWIPAFAGMDVND